jgi:prepilin-type N-terminal cleavage/methylation domain-containing protein
MRNSKGFTLVELMVGMLILAAAIAGALSFFIFQSQRGHESFRDKNTDEAVFSALAVMSRDVHAAGLGVVSDYPKLALLVKRTANLPDALYLSYDEYMDIQYYERDATLTFLRGASIWCAKGACRDVQTTGSGYQGYVTLTDTANLRLYAIPQRASTSLNSNVGAILVDVNSSVPDAEARDVNVKLSSAVNRTDPIGTQDWTFPIVAEGTALASTMVAVPAVSYKIKYYSADGTLYTGSSTPPSYTAAGGVMFGSLWRNRGPDGNAYNVPILGWSPQGGNPFINIRDFQVRRQYKDGGWDVVRNAGETPEISPNPRNVRMLEIALTYQTNISKSTVQTGTDKPMAVWSQPVTRVMRVSPRHLALLGA